MFAVTWSIVYPQLVKKLLFRKVIEILTINVFIMPICITDSHHSGSRGTIPTPELHTSDLLKVCLVEVSFYRRDGNVVSVLFEECDDEIHAKLMLDALCQHFATQLTRDYHRLITAGQRSLVDASSCVRILDPITYLVYDVSNFLHGDLDFVAC